MVRDNSEIVLQNNEQEKKKEEIYKTEEITVEELAIDGICGVY